MQSKPEYINYERAIKRLRERFDGVTPKELAAWVFMTEPKQACAKLNEKRERCRNEAIRRGDICEEHGEKPMLEDEIKTLRQRSLYAYLSARDLAPPPRFFFGNHIGERDYLPLLYQLYFRADDIAQFEPRERFITGQALLGKWEKQTEIPPAERIRIATREDRLKPFHPTLGLTQATNADDPNYAPLEDGLFSLTEVKSYEREEFGWELDVVAAETGASGDTAAKAEAVSLTATANAAAKAETHVHSQNQIYVHVAPHAR